MDTKIIKKSSKICLSLLFGFLIGFLLNKYVQTNNNNNEKNKCSCES